MDCRTPHCLNDAAPGRTICEKCKSRKYREKHLVKSLYIILRSNAKRRGKIFTLTLDEWIIFCAETNYHKLKGTGPEDMTVDCIKSWLGYSSGNIRMLTKRENSSKCKQDKKDKLKNYPQNIYPGVPF